MKLQTISSPVNVMILVSWLLVWSTGNSDAIYPVSGTERLIFGDMTTFLTSEAAVHHMEIDFHGQESLLFSDLSALKTTNGTSTTTLTGSPTTLGYRNGVGVAAQFRLIAGFVQLNKSMILLADYGNHCIRVLNRTNGYVNHFAGNCGNRGFSDGVGILAKFQNPSSVIIDKRNRSRILIADRYNDAIRLVNVETREVSTIIRSSRLDRPRVILWDPNQENTLIVSEYHAIRKLSLTNFAVTDIAGNENGDAEGPIGMARFSFAREAVFLHQHIFVLADYGNNKLRIVDTSNNIVSSICIGTDMNAAGTIENCQVSQPSSMLLRTGVLYIGTKGAIRKLPVRVELITTTSTTTSTTVGNHRTTDGPTATVSLPSRTTSIQLRLVNHVATVALATTATMTPASTSSQFSIHGNSTGLSPVIVPAASIAGTANIWIAVFMSVTVAAIIVALVVAFVYHNRQQPSLGSN